ncbi:PREDICTED: N-acetylated-alpha-linked acidic dipeptidase-like protein [Polistes dominula]|uniref:N-acetylated-alpha-linked acidic dipeptidase-like protein n=1 Tax=Polistes dominula TaxID=743375 RepID=A0ABM1ITC4_POLDO|nr:PREDICTED: N-acetylated-alpha-linked acidic dipeptidase-like protein [Polistes dominula]XP_015183459.1 PREDICTED: N-acetylated-alpha-linked acidic dipeptidase-like protein [Polistes dominula]XP_015183460.1 PREDICTED: N-acetylated-alpha-linked acidic dipeptidase-like protein [Polistes dominula]XP_015183461.1 PREDICTED: N-acetylated-alpha-linked acidic dipeptidase-like protein [Polistes dominula]XP_015183462.1 PREDICTED: N-acetylated-alpha-linked acidic dipeptidase-like protein [Polistes domin
MHRVLSFQMARGLGESSEFVTKRMCFSFLFSVGFICLLCGFLLGRFASERSIEFRAQRRRLELDGNGLKHNEHLQQFLLQKLGESSYQTSWTNSISKEDIETLKIGEVLSDLPIFHQIVTNGSFVLATSHGSRERDRFVILSASGNGIDIALELAKVLNQLRVEHNWKPRRTLIFCLFLGSLDICPTMMSNFIRHKIVAYIALYDDNLQGNGSFISAGSDVIQSIILQEVKIIRNLNYQNNNIFDLDNQAYQKIVFPRLALDIPHAVISFMKNNNTVNNESFKSHRIPLMQLIGDTIWRLSESLVFHWNVKYFNDTVNNVLETINVSTFLDIKDEIKENVDKLMSEVQVLNQRIDTTDLSKSLDTRIMNDILMDLDRSLLCPDKYFRSKTDLASFHILSEQSPFMLSYLSDLQQCYNAAVQLLQEW